ncbi:hypothetical protein VISP3789_04550 [Vibrio splendidus ATCC 33789]|nr:hypothetical protein VISP3789_04550 [Vibrio splendidus ATCC 33789]
MVQVQKELGLFITKKGQLMIKNTIDLIEWMAL